MWKPFRKVKYAWQRLTRGWDDRECWDLQLHMAKLLLPRLRRFRELRKDDSFMMAGFPLAGDGYTNERWEADIDLIITAFEYIASNDDDIAQLPFEAYCEAAKRRDEVKEAGCKKFGELFQAFWD